MSTIRLVQDMMRQMDSVRDLLEAAQRQKDLVLTASESLKFSASALEAARLTPVSDAIRDAMSVNTSILDIGRPLAVQMEIAASMTAALNIDTSALDAANNLTLAADAMRNAPRVDTSALALTNTLAQQMDTATAMRAAFQVDAFALDWANTMAPQFDATRSLVAALQRAVPEFPKFELSTHVQQAMRGLSAMNIAPQLAAALEPPASLATLMRAVAAHETSFALPTALLDAQRAAASIASAIRLADLTPERFGLVFAEGAADAAWLRLRAKAEAIAADDSTGAEAVVALAEDADALAAAVPAEAKGRVTLLVQMVLLALIVDLLKDGVKVGGSALLPYLMALPLMFQLAVPRALPPVPAPFSAPTRPGGALGIPRHWETAGLPAIIRRAGPEAERRTVEFFETGIANRNTRQAYAQAVMRFMTWCEDRSLELADITVFTVTAYAEEMGREYSARTVRQHLGAIRGLFDHLVVGKVVPVNPASLVRGPKAEGVGTRTKPAVLQPQEVRVLLDSVDVGDYSGLRDRALIAVMAYGLARVSALVAMDVKDFMARDNQARLRLRDRGAEHEIPLHPRAKEYLEAYLEAAGIMETPDSPLWRTMTKERTFSADRVSRVDVFRMVKRRLRDACLPEAANCDSIRTAGITAYLAGGGTRGRATLQVELGAITPADIGRIEI